MTKCECLVCSLAFLGLGGCGVKGDPVPPVTPAEIGSGKPTYKAPESQNPAAVPLTTPEREDRQDEEE